MAKITINLLPDEFRLEEVKRAKFVKMQALGVVVILIMIFLSSLTVALSILQSRNLSQFQSKVSGAEQRISKSKDTQAQLLLLQNRLTVIREYFGTQSEQVQMYKLLESLLPASISINSIAIDKGGGALILAIAPDGNSVDQLFTNLLSEDSSGGKISKVNIESLSRGRDGIYRISFKVVARI